MLILHIDAPPSGDIYLDTEGNWSMTSFSFVLANIVLLKSIIFCQPFTQKILQGLNIFIYRVWGSKRGQKIRIMIIFMRHLCWHFPSLAEVYHRHWQMYLSIKNASTRWTITFKDWQLTNLQYYLTDVFPHLIILCHLHRILTRAIT